MPDTNYVDYQTTVSAGSLQDLNNTVYRLLGDSSGAGGTGGAPATRADILANLGTLSAAQIAAAYLSAAQAAAAYLTNVSTIAALRGMSPTANQWLYVRGYYSDGDGGQGVFRPVVGGAPGAYTDDGGSTIVPTGGDGSSAWLAVFDGDIPAERFGARGDNSSTGNEVFINKAFAFNLAYSGGVRSVILPLGRVKTNGPIVATTPYYGYGGWAGPVGSGLGNGTTIAPQSAFEAFDVQPIYAGYIHDYAVDWTDVGAANITSACVDHWLLKGTTAASQQIAATTFSRIYGQRGYRQFQITSADLGQLWDVTFDHLMAQWYKDWGWVFDCSGGGGSSNLRFVQLDCEGANVDTGFGGWTTTKGLYVLNVNDLSIDNYEVARMDTIQGGALALADCGKVTTGLLHIEGGSFTAPVSGYVSFMNCGAVVLDAQFITTTINPGAGQGVSFVYVDPTTNIVVQSLSERSTTVTSGTRNWINFDSTATANHANVLDAGVSRDQCILPAYPTSKNYRFVPDSGAGWYRAEDGKITNYGLANVTLPAAPGWVSTTLAFGKQLTQANSEDYSVMAIAGTGNSLTYSVNNESSSSASLNVYNAVGATGSLNVRWRAEGY